MLFIHWNTDPVIIDFGAVALRWYGLLFVSGFLMSHYILQRYFTREGIPLKLLDTLTIYVIVGAVIGARLGHCLFYDFTYYAHHIPEIFLPVKFTPEFQFVGYQGLASHGGALGILASLGIFRIKHKLPFWWLLDRLALVVPLAGCCIRLGNLMNSEILGKPTNLPWAFVFEREDSIPRHPAQLYEAAAYLLVFLLVNLLYKKVSNHPGFLFGLFLTMLFSIRFLVEFIKENQSAFEVDMVINMGQLLSIPFILLGLILIFTRRSVSIDYLRFLRDDRMPRNL